VDNQCATESKNIVDAAANNFKSIYNSSYPTVIPYSVTPDFF
jgi:hypothetical protein